VFIIALGAPASVAMVATSTLVLASSAASALFTSEAAVDALHMHRRPSIPRIA
jgi:hypothetical protein